MRKKEGAARLLLLLLLFRSLGVFKLASASEAEGGFVCGEASFGVVSGAVAVGACRKGGGGESGGATAAAGVGVGAAGVMAASMALDGDVRKSLLDRTDAEKVFRPWWDTVEDMLLNTLIALGRIESYVYLRHEEHSKR